MKDHQEQYIQFTVGLQKFAFVISEVHEIIKMQKITKVPDKSSLFTGYIHVRGLILPVVEIGHLLGIKSHLQSKSARIVVMIYQDKKLGLMVDKVNKVAKFDRIQTTENTQTSLQNTYTFGVEGEELTGILELDKLMINAI